jgi:hypothetical protein
VLTRTSGAAVLTRTSEGGGLYIKPPSIPPNAKAHRRGVVGLEREVVVCNGGGAGARNFLVASPRYLLFHITAVWVLNIDKLRS